MGGDVRRTVNRDFKIKDLTLVAGKFSSYGS
jgi:hypothetical protein